ncbi:hypothetical protein GCM10007160_28290 [Litchfieldella qijiaojingensis]|uniref:Uncharacterized protein n=1 Tax=Litchfieldella qijiaojingensis TaxID=980347 RepID=A0ABQ2Z1I2_9GAMM|nr:hypothetical protein [Halomonas qijiaojingensis]GGX99034.1 hypothetical protein GCM10007160_28290 [Halomonas qijiaojingensis]
MSDIYRNHTDSGNRCPITSPVGTNVFVLRAVSPDATTDTIFHGVAPFWLAGMGRAVLVLLFPSIALLLPQLLY